MQLTSSWIALSLSLGALAQLAPKQFDNLPLGSVRPTGWLGNQLQLQADGLAGHEHEFYSYISDNTWWGGSSTYSDLQEGGSYWFNGMVPNGVLTGNQNVLDAVKRFIDAVLDGQEDGGWMGPEVGNDMPRYFWGRYPFFFGAIQYAEAFPDYTDRIVTALHKFTQLASTMMQNNQGLEEWGEARYGDYVIVLQWLYDNYPNGNEELLLDTMNRLRQTGLPWEQIYSEQNFPTGPTEGQQNPVNGLGWHGVNVAESFKFFPAMWRVQQNQSDIDVGNSGWALLQKYHGRPNGMYGADEYLAGLGAHRGTELCAVVETMYSANYFFQVTGDVSWLDKAERIAYNALPATITGDMWHRQYLQQENQIAAKSMDPNPFPSDGPYSNVFGLEPNYPCCTVNFPQGWPKFASHTVLKTGDGAGLLQAYHTPGTVTATLSNDNAVNVTIDTLYPFSDDITTTVSSTKDFAYHIRIPGWASGATVAVGDGEAVSADAGSIYEADLTAGETKLTIHLPADITTEDRPNGSISFHRGPLHYSLDLAYSTTTLPASPQAGSETRATEFEFDATSEWRYAIDPSTAKFTPGDAPSELPSPLWESGKSPFTLSIEGCVIDWDTAGDTFASVPPQSPVQCADGQERTTLSLAPYGNTKLRISEFPVLG